MSNQDELDTLTSLLAELNTAVAQVTTYLKTKNLPEPNLYAHMLPREPEIFEARNMIRRASAAMQMLTEYDASEYFMNQCAALPYAISPLHVAVKFGVPLAVGDDEEVEVRELAQRVGCEDVSRLADIMRLCVQQFVFRQPRPDVFAHNKFSLQLRSDAVCAIFHLTNGMLMKGAPHVYEQISRFPNSRDPKHSAWAIGNGTADQASFYEYLATPEGGLMAKTMADAMASSTSYSLDAMGKVYPWASLQGKHIVDVGGNEGHVAMFLAPLIPGATFTIQDLEHNVAQAKKQDLPEGVASRISFEVHDFFTPQPRVADVYFMRWILHNHPDYRAVEIIKSLVPQLKPGKNGSGGRILTADTVIEKQARPPLGWENQAMNLCMFALHNSNERTFDETKKLFLSADPRFKLKQYGANGPMASEIIEAWLENEDSET